MATDPTPVMGTEVSGIQISNLSAAGKDELAQRKVVAFRARTLSACRSRRCSISPGISAGMFLLSLGDVLLGY